MASNDTTTEEGSPQAVLKRAESFKWDHLAAARACLEHLLGSYKLCIIHKGRHSKKIDRIMKDLKPGENVAKVVNLHERKDGDALLASLKEFGQDEEYIFIEGLYVGDIEDLYALHSAGKLQCLLSEAPEQELGARRLSSFSLGPDPFA